MFFFRSFSRDEQNNNFWASVISVRKQLQQKSKETFLRSQTYYRSFDINCASARIFVAVGPWKENSEMIFVYDHMIVTCVN